MTFSRRSLQLLLALIVPTPPAQQFQPHPSYGRDVSLLVKTVFQQNFTLTQAVHAPLKNSTSVRVVPQCSEHAVLLGAFDQTILDEHMGRYHIVKRRIFFTFRVTRLELRGQERVLLLDELPLPGVSDTS